MLPLLLGSVQIQGGQLVVAVVCAARFVMTFLLPESKGRSLEEMAHVAGWQSEPPDADRSQPRAPVHAGDG